jgi:multiple sugar transport system substrate-binding protein
MKMNVKLFSLALACAGASYAQSPTTVSMWVHAGPGPEANAYVQSVKLFNQANKDIQIDLIKLPEGTYNDQVNAAALAKKLPCLLDFDGPNVYNFAWTGKLRALDAFPELTAIKADLLPSILKQGTYSGKLYSLGQYDSGLAIWGNKALLAKAGVRIPSSIKDAWTLKEFEDNLKKLKSAGVAQPLDMKFNYGVGEWFTYGFSPIVQSFGGDLLDRKTYKQAKGSINSEASVRALTALQSWVKAGYVNAATKDDGDFVKGKSALSYVGHWVYSDYKKALGKDLVLIPMPAFGAKAVTGAGSWNFGISADCKAPQAAAKVLAHLMSEPEITRVTQANGAMPATLKALAKNSNYTDQGDLAVYVQQAKQGVSLVRPETPAYPVISTAFSEAVNNIVAGQDVKKELDKAAKKIDQAIEDNRGYPAPK